MRNATDKFADGFSKKSLGKTVATGTALNLAVELFKVVTQLIAISFLARRLSTADFGLVGMVAVLTNFAAIFADSGLAIPTIQRKDISESQVSNLFWLSICSGAFAALITVSAAPLIAWVFNEPRLIAITLTISISFIITSASVQHRALLRRGMRFRSLGAIAIIGSAVGQGAAIIGSLILAPNVRYWSLVFVPVVSSIATATVTFALCRWIPRMPSRGHGTRDLFNVGASLTSVNVLNYFARNFDNFWIGFVCGKSELGLYDQAYKIFLLPIRRCNQSLNSVMIPTLSRLVDDNARYRRAYCEALSRLTLLLIPGSAFVIVSAHEIVLLVLGAGWQDAAPILQALAVTGVSQAIGMTFGWIHVSQDRISETLRLAIILTPILMAFVAIGVAWGALGVAVLYIFYAMLISFPIRLYAACRVGAIRIGDIARSLNVAIVAALTVAIMVTIAKYALEGADNWLKMLTFCVVAVLSWVASIMIVPAGRKLVVETANMYRELRHRSSK